jgi:ribosomal-protein-serine acetyltransferase
MFTCLLGDDAALLPRTTAIADAYQALLAANHGRLAEWFPGGFETPPSMESTRANLDAAGRAWLDGSQLPLVIAVAAEADWRLVGWVNVIIDSPGRSAELGFWIDAEFEGRGLVTRSASAVLDHAFGPLGLHRVEVQTTTDNIRSRSVAQRLGFRQEGVLREAAAFPGATRDVVVYGLLSSEWREPRRSSGAAGAR